MMMIKLHSLIISSISNESMTHAGNAALLATLRSPRLVSLDSKAGPNQRLEVLLEKQGEHADAGDTVANLEVLVVIWNTASQTLRLFQLVGLHEILYFREHPLTLG